MEALISNGISFPPDSELTKKYEKYLINEKVSSPIKQRPKEDNLDLKDMKRTTEYKLDLNPENYDKKYKKFCGELEGLLNKVLKFNVKTTKI